MRGADVLTRHRIPLHAGVRGGERRRFRLAQADRLREERTEPSEAEVRQDLLTYVENVIAAPQIAGQPEVRRIGPQALAQRIADRAGGSFLYLSLWAGGLRDAVANGDTERVAALTALSVLPAGLDGIYEYFLVVIRDTVKRREGPQWTHVWKLLHLRLLAAFAVAQAPLPRRTLLLLTDLTADRAGPGKRHRCLTAVPRHHGRVPDFGGRRPDHG